MSEKCVGISTLPNRAFGKTFADLPRRVRVLTDAPGPKRKHPEMVSRGLFDCLQRHRPRIGADVHHKEAFNGNMLSLDCAL